MSNATHTKGPWHVVEINAHWPRGCEIAIDDNNGDSRNYYLATVVHDDPDELLANARLVAAAPVMLETLKLLEISVAFDEKLNGGDPTRCATGTTVDLAQVLRMCRAAIARAEGKS